MRDADTGLYDLDRFNPACFERLRHYLTVARRHQAVVNLEWFDRPAVSMTSAMSQDLILCASTRRDAHEMHRLHQDPQAYIAMLDDPLLGEGEGRQSVPLNQQVRQPSQA